MFKKIGLFIYNRLRVTFLKHKYFFGDYAENLIEMRKFIAERRVIVITVMDERFKPTVIKPDVADPILALEIMKEQMRIQSRKLRKQHKAQLWYVEDHFFTRLLGFKPMMKI